MADFQFRFSIETKALVSLIPAKFWKCKRIYPQSHNFNKEKPCIMPFSVETVYLYAG